MCTRTAACLISLSFTILELAQTHVHWVDDAIQPSRPLASPSPALNLSSVQFNHSVGSDSLWPYGLQHTRLPCPSPTQSFLKFMSMELVMPSNHLILCLPLILLSSIFPSIRVFSNESFLPIQWPKYWSFSFCISLFNEYSLTIFFKIDWFDPLAVQGTLQSLLQHHSSKASILRCSAFFIVQLSHPPWPLEKP